MFNAARAPYPLSRTPRGTVMPMDPPNPNHHSRAASFFGGMCLLVLLIGACVAVAAI